MVDARCLVIGHGSIGKRHARNLAQLGQQVGVVEPDAGRRAEAADVAGSGAFDSLDAAWKAGPWDAAIVASPTAAHVDDALACVRNGVHVLIEKPLAPTFTRTTKLEREVRERGLVAMVGFNLRFHPALVEARRWIRSGAVGRPVHVHATYGNYLPRWRPARDYRQVYSSVRAMGGGILLDATHEIDYVDWLIGRTPVDVSARLTYADELQTDVESVADIALDYGAGTTATLHLDALDRRYSRGFRVVGTEGTIGWTWQGPVVRYGADGSEAERVALEDHDFGTTYVDLLREFLAAIADGRAVPPSLAEGSANVATVRAVRRADALGRRVPWRRSSDVVAVAPDPQVALELRRSALVDEVVDEGEAANAGLVLSCSPGTEAQATDAFIRERLLGRRSPPPPGVVEIGKEVDHVY